MGANIKKERQPRLRSGYTSSVISISLVLFILGLLGLLAIDARKISDYIKEHVEINLFLTDDASVPDIMEFQKSLGEMDFVLSTTYVSREAALDSLKKELGEGATGMLESNPLPSTIDIRVKADYARTDSLERIKQRLSGNRIIREIAYQASEVEKLNSNFRTIALVLLVFCVLLFIVSVALINNTIRLSMYSKRFLIKSMQLVGATRSFIRWPFLRKGMVHGIYSSLVAILLLCGIIYLIYTRFPELNQLSELRILGCLFAGILLTGVVLSGISTYFAVNRFLGLKSSDVF
ncbi:MAG: cell division protein FtsX [Bacteroidia bacterium]|nr:cell division protein FtsX [Bacteroidia bacterium]